jgi:hypothetical protein
MLPFKDYLKWHGLLLFFFSDFDYPLKSTRFFLILFFIVISLFFVQVDCQIKPLISNLKAFVKRSEIFLKNN